MGHATLHRGLEGTIISWLTVYIFATPGDHVFATRRGTGRRRVRVGHEASADAPTLLRCMCIRFYCRRCPQGPTSPHSTQRATSQTQHDEHSTITITMTLSLSFNDTVMAMFKLAMASFTYYIFKYCLGWVDFRRPHLPQHSLVRLVPSQQTTLTRYKPQNLR